MVNMLNNRMLSESLPRQCHWHHMVCYYHVIFTIIANDIVKWWHEFELGTSPEAVFVRDLDKMEMMMQCYQYEMARNMDLPDGFFSR